MITKVRCARSEKIPQLEGGNPETGGVGCVVGRAGEKKRKRGKKPEKKLGVRSKGQARVWCLLDDEGKEWGKRENIETNLRGLLAWCRRYEHHDATG